jgi:hypothetical protein
MISSSSDEDYSLDHPTMNWQDVKDSSAILKIETDLDKKANKNVNPNLLECRKTIKISDPILLKGIEKIKEKYFKKLENKVFSSRFDPVKKKFVFLFPTEEWFTDNPIGYLLKLFVELCKDTEAKYTEPCSPINYAGTSEKFFSGMYMEATKPSIKGLTKKTDPYSEGQSSFLVEVLKRTIRKENDISHYKIPMKYLGNSVKGKKIDLRA